MPRRQHKDNAALELRAPPLRGGSFPELGARRGEDDAVRQLEAPDARRTEEVREHVSDSEVRALHLGVVQQLLPGAVEGDEAGLHDVGVI